APGVARERREAPRNYSAAPPPPASTAVLGRPQWDEGRLDVKDVAAVTSLADLLARVGGREIGRREEASGTLVDVILPRARYEEFVRGLEALGTWSGPSTVARASPP